MHSFIALILKVKWLGLLPTHFLITSWTFKREIYHPNVFFILCFANFSFKEEENNIKAFNNNKKNVTSIEIIKHCRYLGTAIKLGKVFSVLYFKAPDNVLCNFLGIKLIVVARCLFYPPANINPGSLPSIHSFITHAPSPKAMEL